LLIYKRNKIEIYLKYNNLKKNIVKGKWIVVGGTGRNIGKTTLVEILINYLSVKHDVIGIKISNMKPENMKYHGNHDFIPDNYLISEENNKNGNKDSMRYLKAGANRSYFVQVNDANLENVLPELLMLSKNDEIVVCESNSLSKVISPNLFFMVKGKFNYNSKKDWPELIKKADLVVPAMDIKAFNNIAQALDLKDDKIQLQEGFSLG